MSGESILIAGRLLPNAGRGLICICPVPSLDWADLPEMAVIGRKGGAD